MLFNARDVGAEQDSLLGLTLCDWVMYLSLSLVRWAERECARSQSVALGLEADCDYEIPGADISKVVGVGAGSSPVRSRRWRRRQTAIWSYACCGRKAAEVLK